MKNLKKAYRLYVNESQPSIKEAKIQLIEFARALGINVSDKALDSRNSAALRRQNFWQNLRYKAMHTLQLEVVKFLQESGQLYIGRELYSDEDLQVVVSIRENSASFKDVSGRMNGGWNILNMGFDFSKLPGDDPEGDEFWEERKSK